MPRRNSNVENHRRMKDVKQVEPRDRYGADLMRLCIELNVPMPREGGWSTFDWSNHYAREKHKPKRKHRRNGR